MQPFDFLSDRQLRQDLDSTLLAALPPGRPPVFVLGLHRSGTTFLYQLLADHFGLATCSLYHVTHFNRLLHARQAGLEDGYKADVQAELTRRGLSDRGIDGFPVGPDGLEEYGFILKKFSPDGGLTPRGGPVLDALLTKLSALQPAAPAVLLKNPLDLGNAVALKQRYPDARFVFIRRDPVRVLNSQFRNSFYYRRRPDPFLAILIAGIAYWRYAFKLFAFMDRVLPDRVYQKIVVEGLRRTIHADLRKHHATLAQLDPACYVEVRYEDVIQDAAPALGAVARLLNLPMRPGIEPMATNPRLEPLFPAVEAVAEAFRRQLAGLPDAELRAVIPQAQPETAAR
ncbi:MAG: Sulfotransferase family [Cyanobacteria bacterium RYN_339]|nr:Sulfotransferase family [Cyanobacteria bacterium RYN_339]